MKLPQERCFKIERAIFPDVLFDIGTFMIYLDFKHWSGYFKSTNLTEN